MQLIACRDSLGKISCLRGRYVTQLPSGWRRWSCRRHHGRERGGIMASF